VIRRIELSFPLPRTFFLFLCVLCAACSAACGRKGPPLAPIVFSWLARQGSGATRLDPRDMKNARDLRTTLAALFRDERLFYERLEQRAGTEP